MTNKTQPPLSAVPDMPAYPPEEPKTPTESPLSKAVEEAVDRAFSKLSNELHGWIDEATSRICKTLGDIGHRLTVYELTQQNLEGRIQRLEDSHAVTTAAFDRRLSDIERARYRDTQPAPAPDHG
jgi:hypothetical protein